MDLGEQILVGQKLLGGQAGGLEGVSEGGLSGGEDSSHQVRV